MGAGHDTDDHLTSAVVCCVHLGLQLHFAIRRVCARGLGCCKQCDLFCIQRTDSDRAQARERMFDFARKFFEQTYT